MELGKVHERTVAEWTRLVESVEADQWQQPTPCSEWSVRDLVNHVVAEDLWTAPLLQGSTIEEVGDRFDGDLLGDDPVARAGAAAAVAVAAVADRLPRGGTVHLSYGEEHLDEYVYQLAADHLVHGWDLAVATGTDGTFDPELVGAIAGWYADREDVYRLAGAVAPRPAESGDDALSQLVAAFGRDPRWSPAAD